MQVIFRSGLKILCDGYVMNVVFLEINILKIKYFLCDGYVINSHKSYLMVI